jgi:hypothetical protein
MMGGWVHEAQIGYLGGRSKRIGIFLLHVDIERNDVHDAPSYDVTTQWKYLHRLT